MEQKAKNTLPELEFDVKYFRVNDEAADPQSRPAQPEDDQVHVEVAATLTRKQHDLLVDMSTNIAVQKSENTGKFLIMLNDSSLSMNGTPFDTLVGSLITLGDVLFHEGGPTCNMF